MGKLKRLAELEADVAYWQKRAELLPEVRQYIACLAEMPEDAVLLYTRHGMQIQHEIGLSARRLLEKIA